MSERSEMARPWLPSRGFFGQIDGGTVLVVLLWGGILLLVPRRPLSEVDRPLAPTAIVAAIPSGLSELPLALRPDLIALPSAVSFGADVSSVDSLQGVPRMPIRRDFLLPPPAASILVAWTVVDPLHASRVALAQPQESHYAGAVPILKSVASIHASSNRLSVVCSKALGATAIRTEAVDAVALLLEGKSLEAEITVRFDKVGAPADIFLESSQGDPLLAQALIRQLWNPAMWQQASGQGRVSIRYVPKMGGMNANTGDNMGAR